MSASFNPPPNWPKPPEGWEPEPGWQPDPAWGPAPEGWNFWVDENGRPIGGDAQGSNSEAAASSGTAGTGSASTGSSASDAPTQPISATSDYGSTGSGWGSAGTAAGAGAAGAGAASFGAASAHGSGDPQNAWGDSGNYSSGSQGSGSGASGWGTGAAAGGAGSSGWNGGVGPGGNGGWNGNGGEPPKKKGFFASTAGILTIVGSLVLILVIALVLFTTGVFGGKDEASDTTTNSPSQSQEASSPSSDQSTSSSDESASASDESSSSSGESSSSSSSNGSEPTVEGYSSAAALKTFEGTGSKTVEIGKLDPGRYVLTYVYEGDHSIMITGKDSSGGTQLLDIDAMNSTAGAAWLNQNAKETSDVATQLKVEEIGGSSGKWKLAIYDKAYKVEKGNHYSGRGTYASFYEGGAATLKFHNTSDSGMTVDVFDQKGYSLAIEYVKAGATLNVKVPSSAKQATIQVGGTNYEDTWDLDVS